MIILPIFLIWAELFCVFFLVKTEFWIKNFEIINIIDTVLVGICGLHFIFFYFLYTRISKIYLSCIYSLVILNFLYIYLTDELYYFVYYSIILNFTFLPFWKKKN